MTAGSLLHAVVTLHSTKQVSFYFSFFTNSMSTGLSCNFSEGARRPLHLRRDRIPKASRILPSFYQNITCTGTEDSIIDCGGDKASSSGSCQPDLIAGVKCAGTTQRTSALFLKIVLLKFIFRYSLLST